MRRRPSQAASRWPSQACGGQALTPYPPTGRARRQVRLRHCPGSVLQRSRRAIGVETSHTDADRPKPGEQPTVARPRAGNRRSPRRPRCRVRAVKQQSRPSVSPGRVAQPDGESRRCVPTWLSSIQRRRRSTSPRSWLRCSLAFSMPPAGFEPATFGLEVTPHEAAFPVFTGLFVLPVALKCSLYRRIGNT